MTNIEMLSDEQLEELKRQSPPEAAQTIDQILDYRRRLGEQVEAARPRPRAARQLTPTARHLRAAENFNADAGQRARWEEAVAEATQPDGSVEMTPKIIQLSISAYYTQRKRDKDGEGNGDAEAAEAEAEGGEA